MKRYNIGILSVILSIILLFTMFPVEAFGAKIIESGICGDNLTWTIDENGVLEISGIGDIPSYYDNKPAPWSVYSNSVKSIRLSEKIRNIGQLAFCTCSVLESISIPAGVLSIGDRAFSGCSKLTTITMQSGLLSIGDYAFNDCGSLISVFIPDTVGKIGRCAFQKCNSLQEIKLPSKLLEISPYLFFGCSNLESITLPDTVFSIGYAAFYNCRHLKSINIPDSVQEIGEAAFQECSELTTIEIPNSVCEIEKRAFSGCSSLIKVAFPVGLTAISEYVFYNCFSLEEIRIPDTVVEIGNAAFYECSSLKRIEIPLGTKIIGEHVFSDCSELETISIGHSVQKIGDWTFSGCEKLLSIEMPDSVTEISSHLFADCYSLYDVKLSDKTTIIDQEAFRYCRNLKQISIPGLVNEIADGAFKGCERIVEIEIPNGVSIINDDTFSGCDSLTTVFIPQSVISIGNAAFWFCDNLRDVFYSGTEEEWKQISIDSLNTPLDSAKIHFNANNDKESGDPSDDRSPIIEEFHEKSYIADIWLDLRDDDFESIESKTIESILGIGSISTDIYNSLKEDKAFQGAVLAWKGFGAVFDPASSTEDVTYGMTELYEAIIFDLLENALEGDETQNILLDSVETLGDGAKAVTSAKKHVDDMIGTLSDAAETARDIHLYDISKSEIDVETLIKLDSFNRVCEKYTDNKVLGFLDMFLDTAENVAEFFQLVEGFQLAVNMADDMKALLTAMRDATEELYLKSALSNVIAAVDNADWASFVCTARLAEKTSVDVAKALIKFAYESNPITRALKLGYDAGKVVSNFFYNTDGIIDAYYECMAMRYFMSANKQAIKNLATKYMTSKAEEDAGAYVYSVRMYQHVYLLDFDATLNFVKQGSEEGLVNAVDKLTDKLSNWIFHTNITRTYDDMLENKESIMSSLASNFECLTESWKFNELYLKTDYPDIYPIYVAEEYSKDVYTPKILSAKLNDVGKSEITYSLDCYYVDEETNEAHALYGVNAMSGIEVTETVGGEKTVETTDYTYEKSVVSMYNADRFFSFPKNYSVAGYADTSEGRVYTKSSEKDIGKPCKEVTLFILRTDRGIVMGILDPSSTTYKGIRYHIYRKEVGGSYSEIDCISRFNLLGGRITPYLDATVIDDTTYIYKVVSELSFTNGASITSGDSNEFAIKPSTDTPTVKTVVVSDNRNSSDKKTSSVFAMLAITAHATGDNGISLSWEAIDGADGYEILRKSSIGTYYKHLASVNGNMLSYIDDDIIDGVDYEYMVVPYTVEAENIVYDTSVVAEGEYKHETTAATYGDVNLDGKVDATDARLALRVAAKLDTLPDDQLAIADIDGNGIVNAIDARRILRIAAKLDPIPDADNNDPAESTVTEPTPVPTTSEPTSVTTTAASACTTAADVAPVDTASDLSDIKVGLICLHDKNSTYDLNFIIAMEETQRALGLTDEQVIIKTNVPEGFECFKAAVELAEAGCDIVFADSFGHEDYMLQAAREYPDVQFCHATGTKAHTENVDNYHNAFAAIYEGRFLTGVAAGLKLNEMIKAGTITAEEAKIGYVGAYPYAEVISDYTSFYLGAKYVCPSATMKVIYTNSWYDEGKEKEVANTLINADKCVLISQYSDSLGAPSACEAAGVPNVSYNGSTKAACPNTYIISSRINWAPYYEHAIKAVVAGEAIDTDYVGTIATGSVELAELNEDVAAEGTAAKIERVKAQLEAGTIHVFDTSTFTVDGKTFTSYLADVDYDVAYTADTEVISDGYFHESEYRSAPYFDLAIDGIDCNDEQLW